MSKIKEILNKLLITNESLQQGVDPWDVSWHVANFGNQTPFEQVGEFHSTFGHPAYVYGEPPVTNPGAKMLRLRLKLITEELRELVEASLKDDILLHSIKNSFSQLDSHIDKIHDDDIKFDVVEVADALGDINYVVQGAAHVFNIDLDSVTSEIHRSNMSKLDPDTGMPIYNEAGKILKGKDYSKPDIKAVLGIEN